MPKGVNVYSWILMDIKLTAPIGFAIESTIAHIAQDPPISFGVEMFWWELGDM